MKRMENQCLILGKVNAGKTLFLINFAEFIGLKDINLTLLHPDGYRREKKMPIAQARRILISSQPHKTRCLQKVVINLPARKGKKEVVLVDSSGVIEGIHVDKEIRSGIAQTLSEIKESKLILHIFDVSSVIAQNNLSEIDKQICNFAKLRGGYLILANKMDMPGSENGLARIKEELDVSNIIPISSKTKLGFKEVKAFVVRNI